MTNLFKGWPPDRIAVVHQDTLPEEHDVCRTYYRLTEADFRDRCYARVLRLPFAVARRVGSATHLGRLERLGRDAQYVERIFAGEMPQRATPSPALVDWIARFSPDLIYTFLGSNAIMDLTRAVADRFGLPIAVHFMDDWPTTAYDPPFGNALERRRMMRQLRWHIENSAVAMAICPQMASEYEERFGRTFSSFQNIAELADWPSAEAPCRPAGQPAQLVYTGSIYGIAQSHSLIDTCEAVAALNETGLETTFDIYSHASFTDDYRSRLEIHPAIRIKDALTDDTAFRETICNADVLLLPVNFDAASRRRIRLSMPTKLPPMLASGTPILAYGPENTAQIDYALQEGWGFVVSNRDREQLVQALKTLIQDDGVRDRLSHRAKRVAFEHHDGTAIRSGFHTLLSGIVRK